MICLVPQQAFLPAAADEGKVGPPEKRTMAYVYSVAGGGDLSWVEDLQEVLVIAQALSQRVTSLPDDW